MAAKFFQMVLNIGKLVAEARAADPSFTPKENENILCFHQNMLYEAKVRRARLANC